MVRCVLIIDADQDERRWLEQAVGSFGYPVLAVAVAGEALEAISAPSAPRITLALLNVGASPEEDAARTAAAVLERLGRLPDHPPLIALAAAGANGAVAKIMRAGAADVLVKPLAVERLEISVANALKISALERELERSRRRAEGFIPLDDIVANGDEMKRVVASARRAAVLAVPILLEGEPGTGKELVARAIHGASARAGGPFVCVNCAAIPPQRIEETLFGRDYGQPATGGIRLGGKFGQAVGGSLFLEEPGELPPRAQERLWRILKQESAEFFAGYPGEAGGAGGGQDQRHEHSPEFLKDAGTAASGGKPRTDVRLIAASSQDLIGLAKTGAFREDLYLRLNAFPVLIPPLRERMEDIPELAERFVARFAAEEGKRVDGVEPEALDLIQRYAWPGNVRQLENAVYRAVVLAESHMLTVSDFPQIAAHVEGFTVKTPPAPAFEPRAAFSGPAMIGAGFPVTHTIDLGPAHGPGPGHPSRRAGAPSGPSGGGQVVGIPALNEQGEVRPLEAVEADMIRLAVGHYRGHMTEVARRLGIGRSTLYRKLREIGVDAGAQ